MKKTLLLTIEYPPQRGGVGVYLAGLAGALDPQQLIVLAERCRNNFEFDTAQRYPVRRETLAYRFFWPGWLKAFLEARKAVQEEGISQLIISHVLPMGYVALLLRIPYIVVCHGMDVALAKRTPWKSFMAELILKRAQRVIANSRYTKSLVTSLNVPEGNIGVVYPCPEPARAVSDEAITAYKAAHGLAGKKIFLSVGRLVERKGHDMVIRALATIDDPDLLYVIAGDGPYKKTLERIAQECGVSSRVRFAGTVTDEERAVLYRSSIALVMPSRIIRGYDVEGFGLVYLEAATYGVPSIGGDSGGVPEAVMDGVTGYIVDPESPEAVATALQRLAADPALAGRMGAAAQERAARDFTWEKQIEGIRGLV